MKNSMDKMKNKLDLKTGHKEKDIRVKLRHNISTVINSIL